MFNNLHLQYLNILPFTKEESVSRLLEDKIVKDFISTISTMNKSTSEQYISRLNIFNKFFIKEYNGLTINDLVNKIKEGSIDPYNILSKYCGYLTNGNEISTITIKQRVVTVKNLFEYNDIEINPKKFKLKVRLPKIVRKNKEAISKKEIIDILNNCSDIRLKTYLMLL